MGVLAYYLFSGMKEYPYKIPLTLTDDSEIFEHLSETELQFNQSIWSHYKHTAQIQQLISKLLKFNDSDRLTAKDALQNKLFSDKLRLSKASSIIKSKLEDLLYINAFNMNEMENVPLNPIHKCMLYFLVHRVIPESKFTFYKDIFRHVESLCSNQLDGLLRQVEINQLPKSLRGTMQVIYNRFSHTIDAEEH